MRGPLLIPVLLLAMALSGCLADSSVAPGQDGGSPSANSNEVVGTDSEGNKIRAGDDLGIITYEDTGDAGVQAYSTKCDDPFSDVNGDFGVTGGPGENRWTIPETDQDGIAWKAKVLTIEVTQDPRTTADIDVFVFDGSGNLLGRSYEDGPDEQDGTNTVSFVNMYPGTLRMEVINCGGASVEYTLTGTADMVATSSDDEGGGPCSVTPKNNGFEASRQETYEDTLTGDSGTADLSTGAGSVTYTGGSGDDYSLVATLRARGDTKEAACEKLAEMYIEHDVADGAKVTMKVHGRVEDDRWENQQIDMVFDAPAAIDWDTFDASTGAGSTDISSVTGDTIRIDTGAGDASVDDIDGGTVTVDAGAGAATAESVVASSLSVDAGAGDATVRDSDVGSLTIDAGAGGVLVSGARADDMDLDAGAGGIDATLDASTSSGDWTLDTGAGSIDLTVKETSSIGYDVDGYTGAGSVTFDFDDVEQTSSDCKYASCHREGRTTGYSSRAIQITIEMDVGAGSITAGS